MTDFSQRPKYNLQKVFLCSASSDTNRQSFRDLADRLGTLIGESGMTLVYGGGQIGLMGISRRSAEAAGAKIEEVITESFASMSGELGANVKTFEFLHERKFELVITSDVLIAQPGGIGTDDEILESHGIADMKRFAKAKEDGTFDPVQPIILINIEGFYSELIAKAKRNVSTDTANVEKYRCVFIARDYEDAFRIRDELNDSPVIYGCDLMRNSPRPPIPYSLADKILDDNRIAIAYAAEMGLPMLNNG